LSGAAGQREKEPERESESAVCHASDVDAVARDPKFRMPRSAQATCLPAEREPHLLAAHGITDATRADVVG